MRRSVQLVVLLPICPVLTHVNQLWCWIADPYNSLRIFTYYLPIWACIMLSAVIYVAVGYHVFHQRNQPELNFSNQAKDGSGFDVRESAEKASRVCGRRSLAAYLTLSSPHLLTSFVANLEDTIRFFPDILLQAPMVRSQPKSRFILRHHPRRQR